MQRMTKRNLINLINFVNGHLMLVKMVILIWLLLVLLETMLLK